MNTGEKPIVPTDIYTQSCGWQIKHGPHLGLDIAGDIVLSCPGAYERIEPIDPLEEISYGG